MGCKVHWNYYQTSEDAQKAAEMAAIEAADLEKQGFDWGYQSPGHIRLPTEQDFHPGFYEVCIP
jgi:hypothetical protein